MLDQLSIRIFIPSIYWPISSPDTAFAVCIFVYFKSYYIGHSFLYVCVCVYACVCVCVIIDFIIKKQILHISSVVIGFD